MCHVEIVADPLFLFIPTTISVQTLWQVCSPLPVLLARAIPVWLPLIRLGCHLLRVLIVFRLLALGRCAAAARSWKWKKMKHH